MPGPGDDRRPGDRARRRLTGTSHRPAAPAPVSVRAWSRGTPSSRATTSTCCHGWRRRTSRYDVVYLDPPYNTGNPFAYDDKVDGPRADRHRTWVAMMRPRLEAVRAVMSERGAVFVSIDDNEVARLRLLMDEVFGEDCFVAQIVVNLNPKGRQLGGGFATSHEYLLVYARSMTDCALDASSPSTVDPRDFPLTDDDGRRYRRLPLRNTNKKFNPITAPTMHFAIYGSPGDRPGRDRALRGLAGDQAGLRRRRSGRLALVGDQDRRPARRPGLPLGRRVRRAGAPTSSSATGCTRGAARSSARSGSPRRSARPTPPCRAQGAGRPPLRVAQADRPAAADPRDDAGRRARARPLRGQRYDGPRGRAPERRGRGSSYLPVGQRAPSRCGPAPTPTWPALPGSAT